MEQCLQHSRLEHWLTLPLHLENGDVVFIHLGYPIVMDRCDFSIHAITSDPILRLQGSCLQLTNQEDSWPSGYPTERKIHVCALFNYLTRRKPFSTAAVVSFWVGAVCLLSQQSSPSFLCKAYQWSVATTTPFPTKGPRFPMRVR